MHFKLLLLGQLLAFGCIVTYTEAHADHDDHAPTTVEPVITTTLPEIVPENEATAQPDDGIQQLDDGLALINKGEALPETTIPPLESTTVPATTEQPHKHHHHAHDFPNPFLYPGYQFPHGLGHKPQNPSAKPEDSPKSKTKGSAYPPFHLDGYPVFRPYSPYGPPHFNSVRPSFIPGFRPGLGYGKPTSFSPDVDASDVSGEKSKAPETEKDLKKPTIDQGYPILRSPYSSFGTPIYYGGRPLTFPGFGSGLGYVHPKTNSPGDEDEDDDSSEKESQTSATDTPQLDSKKSAPEQPNFGYPPVYFIQRRPTLTDFPYGGPSRSYGLPYGYGR